MNLLKNKVGTGLSDEELDAVVNKLKPYFRKYDYPKKAPPSFYHVTNNSKERPDVWVESPEKSIILSITSDIRTIRSEVFAAPYSLRFPRIDRVRYDKPWHECLDVQSFIELVQTSNGSTHGGTVSGRVQQSKQKGMRSTTRKEKRNLSVVPSHLVRTDISGVKEDSLIFSGMMFYFVNVPLTHSLDFLHKMIAENGGTFSMNLNNSVTHCVGAESRGIKYLAAKLHGDIVHYSWVLDCCSQKRLIPLQPKCYLFLSDFSKKKLHEEIDEFSDTYYRDLDLADIKQLLSNVNGIQDMKTLDHYKKKYCPSKWSSFCDCFIYFHASLQSLKPDSEVLLGLTLRRLKVEVHMNGGRVSDSLARATHLVVLSVPGVTLDIENVLKSFNVMEKCLLWKGRLHIVESQWLEDCVTREQKLPEETYSLKPMLEQLNDEDWAEVSFLRAVLCTRMVLYFQVRDGAVDPLGKYDMDSDGSSNLDRAENQNLSSSPNKEGNDKRGGDAPEKPRVVVTLEPSPNRKRGRSAGKSVNKRKAGDNQIRRTRPRIGNKPAKISGNESDDSACHEENIFKEEKKQMGENRGRIDKEISHINKANSGANQARRSPAHTGKRPAKISGNESDDTVFHEENTTKEEVKQMDEEHEQIDKMETVEDLKSSVRHNEIKREGEENSRHGEWFNEPPEIQMMEKYSGEKNKQHKLEVMTGPVNAMLLDMIPSLGKQKTDTTNTRIEDDKPPVDVNAAEPSAPRKKKVSYKDVASELLKDW
ncbi:Ribosomal protein [Parasponia andersonii]|uniref:Ribosomal protein n=1 Tax=Parasponia andersonii TaxID=3476 RepID=A0A2P5C4J7_PARAD|nr:Ribosomal protein [Parasponia andersonii]